MNSPYSSNLLQQPVDTALVPNPVAPAHTRSVTQLVAQPAAPMMQPVYIVSPPRASAVTPIMLALVVILVGAIALIGAYLVAQQSAPSAQEAAIVNNIAARDGFRAGRDRGIDAGRSQALDFASTTTALRAAAALQQAYASAFTRGQRAGRSSYTPRRSTGYSSYRAPAVRGYGNVEIASAYGQAQQLANITGAPVDIEIF